MKLKFKEIKNKISLVKDERFVNSFVKSYLVNSLNLNHVHFVEVSDKSFLGFYEYHHLEGRGDALLYNYYFHNLSLKNSLDVFKGVLDDFESRLSKNNVNILLVRSYNDAYSKILKEKSYVRVTALLEKELKKGNLMDLDKRFKFSNIESVEAKELLFDLGLSTGLNTIDQNPNLKIKKIEYLNEAIGVLGYTDSSNTVMFFGVLLKPDLPVAVDDVVLASLANLEHEGYKFIRIESRIRTVIDKLLNVHQYHELVSVFQKNLIE